MHAQQRGFFFGEESAYNESISISEGPATNQVAELSAGILALEQMLKILNRESWNQPIGQIVIKADSEYLVKGMTEWVFKWELNDYRTSKNTAVANAALFKKLLRLVERLNELGVEVLFWHVPRAYNRKADSLANQAFLIQ